MKNSRPFFHIPIFLGTIAATGCGQLIGLGDFHEAENGGQGGSSGAGVSGSSAGGAGASGGAAGTSGTAGVAGSAGMGGTAATGGAGGMGGSAGTGGDGGVAGSGGQPTYSCSPQTQQFHVSVPADFPGVDLERIFVFSGKNDEFYVSLSGKDGPSTAVTRIRHFGNTGNAKHTHVLTGSAAFKPNAIKHEGSDVTLYGNDEELVSLTFPESNDDPPTRTVLASPCTVRRSHFDDSDPTKYVFQCSNGDVYTSEDTTTPAFSSPLTLWSATHVGGTYLVALVDENDANDSTQFLHSPNWTPVPINVDAAHREQTYLYPSRVAGEALAVTAAYSPSDMLFFSNSFPAAAAPTSSAALVGDTVIGPVPLSQAFVPGRGKPKLNLLSWASYELAGSGVFLSRFNTDGTPQGWRQSVATESSGTVIDAYAATLSSLWSVAVWLVREPVDGGVEYRAEGRVMTCVSQ